MPLIYSDGTAHIGLEAMSTNVARHGRWELHSYTGQHNHSHRKLPKLNASDLTTTGFDLWGSLLVWISETGEISTKWFAEPVDLNIWQLEWNTDNVASDLAIPVVLKALALMLGTVRA